MIDPSDFSDYDDDALARAFSDRARLVISMWNGKFSDGRVPRPEPLPNKDQLVKEIGDIGDEMVARGLTKQARALFDDPDDNVRGWASSCLGPLDPEWQSAARKGALKGKSTQQILGLRAHVRRGRLPGPKLKNCTTEQLLERYEDAGLRRYAVHFLEGTDEDPYSVKERNKCVIEMRKIFDRLQERGETPALMRLFDHPNESVRGTAAIMCLRQFPKHAVRVLANLVGNSETGISTDALLALEFWQKERHKQKAESQAPQETKSS